MRAFWLILIAASASLTGCQSVPENPGSPSVQWPPRSAGAQANVHWLAAFESFDRGRMARFARKLAGAEAGYGKLTLQRPVAVAINRRQIFIVDTELNAVIVTNHRGRRARFLELPEGFRPIAVALSHDEKSVFVADGNTGAIAAFGSRHDTSNRIIPCGTLGRCGGMTACRNGDLLLSDVASGAVLRVSQSGEILASAGTRGHGPGQFNFPTALAEHPDGSVWVLDSLNFRVRQLDAGLRELGGFGELGDGSGQMALPKGLAIDPDGHFYVSDAQFDLIQVFDASGRLLFAIGDRGHGRGQLWNPAGLAISSEGKMAVADSGNHRIHLMHYRREAGSSS